MFLVGSDDFADQFVADDVGVLKANESNSFHGSESLDGFDEARFFAVGEVDLGGVARDDTFGFGPEAGKEHEHLFGGGVLALIQDNKSAVEGASTHVGEGGNFEDTFVHELLNFLNIEHVIEGVVEGTEVGKDFFLKISGEKAEGFAASTAGRVRMMRLILSDLR